MSRFAVKTSLFQGSYEEAKPLYERADEIILRTLGPNHPTMVETLKKWARWLAIQVNKGYFLVVCIYYCSTAGGGFG